MATSHKSFRCNRTQPSPCIVRSHKNRNSLTLPKNILETASVIYRKAVKERLTRGRSIQGVTAATIYLACRQCGLARTLEEIAKASDIPKKRIGESYRLLLRELGYQSLVQKPENYVSKILNTLGVTGKTEELAYKTLRAAREARLTSGRGPTGVAAAACYVASVLTGERITQKDISEMIGCTEVTIRNRYKDLMERLMFEVYL